MAKREPMPFFMGKSNVTKVTAEDGSVTYLTASVTFEEYTDALGADGLVAYNKENKHVLFLFAGNREVKRLYLGKNLQNKSDEEIISESAHVLFFESWNPNTDKTTTFIENGVEKTVKGCWVPCAGYSKQESLVSKVVRFR